MRIALVSDIHGNLAGFEAVLKDIEARGADRIVCLGDVTAFGPRPVECAERLAGLGCPVVMGNTDYYTVNEAPPEVPAVPGEQIAWSRTLLRGEHLEFLRSFVPTHSEGDWLLCCHGGPQSFEHFILADTPAEEVEGYLEGFDAPVFAGGHTHQPMYRQLGDRVFVNPGSAGLPFRLTDRKTLDAAEYAIVSPDGIDFCRVPFDLAAVYRDAQSVGLPHADRWAGR
ncbi:MAG: metallophosphoesterase family protein [Planctomycetota bacterium]|jgi:putative phosphoesterase